jgi:hypothetical protein
LCLLPAEASGGQVEGGVVTFVLAHLECMQCGSTTWSVVPLLLLDEPMICGWCDERSVFPALGEPVQIVPPSSPLTFDWYYRDPERVLLEFPCPS